jgi:hypothetical protein
LPLIDFTFVRDFCTFLLIMFSEALPVKTQAISLPYPGLAASKLVTNPQSSVAKTSELVTNTSPQSKEARDWQGSDCGGKGVMATSKVSKEHNTDGRTTGESHRNSYGSGVIFNIGGKNSSRPSLSADPIGCGDWQGLPRGEKQEMFFLNHILILLSKAKWKRSLLGGELLYTRAICAKMVLW